METNNYKVKLTTIDAVKQFVDVMRDYKGEVGVSSSTKSYTVDGKSILGVISLGFDNDLEVKFYNGMTKSYMTELEPFICA
jgi:phosphotransferase system HPr-like phosphotransfer protein